MIFMSEPQRRSGNSVEPGTSRRSNFDTLHPPHAPYGPIVRDCCRHYQLGQLPTAGLIGRFIATALCWHMVPQSHMNLW
jgi:hypothetical protein